MSVPSHLREFARQLFAGGSSGQVWTKDGVGGEGWADPTAGNGGSSSANWCLLAVGTPDPLSLANDFHQITAAELTILDQSGDDFSVATVDGHGGVVSASGGFFQAGGYIASPSSPTLDAGSDLLRHLWFGVTVGKAPANGGSTFLNILGLDLQVPVYPAGTDEIGASVCAASLPGVVEPGGPAIYNPFIALVGGFGSDSIPLDEFLNSSFGSIAIWQIGAAT